MYGSVGVQSKDTGCLVLFVSLPPYKYETIAYLKKTKKKNYKIAALFIRHADAQVIFIWVAEVCTGKDNGRKRESDAQHFKL